MKSNLTSQPLDKKPTLPRPSAQIVPSQESAEFKNSLANLLARGNPLAPGVARKQTVVKPKAEEETKEKIRFDVFDDEDTNGGDKYKQAGAILDNVSLIIHV